MRARLLNRVLLIPLVFTVALASCATAGAGGSRKSSTARITEEELDDWASQDLFTLVQRLRPSWMQARAPVTFQGRPTVAIIIDGQRRQGSLELLRDFKAADVSEVSFLKGRDATTRYGTDMTAGAIIIITRR